MTASWKTWLWRTFVTAAIVTLIAACFYAEENSRGVNAWTKCEREITARGESLNWDDFVPAPIPDDQNFYKAPMMTEWFVRGSTNSYKTAFTTRLFNPDTTANIITDISASNYVAWSDAFEPEFSQIHDALKRPAAQIDGDYSHPFRGPIQNFVAYRIVSQVLVHRAKCHLLLGEPDKSLDDLTLLHDLNLTLAKSGRTGLLVTSMVHTAITGIYVDTVAYGIDSRSWREPELATFQKQLAQINLLPVVGNSFRANRAGACRVLDTSSIDELLVDAGVKTNLASDLGSWFVPGGWVYQNKAVIATLEGSILEAIDFTNNTISPYKVRLSSQQVEDKLSHRTPWNFIASVTIPNFTKATQTMARNQTWADQARIACALERYRLANGKYPDTLATLTPQYLDKIPHDIINGKPMTYSCKDGQNFTLYSIGWNEVDEGGITAHLSSGGEDRDNGDWVWHYPM